MQIFKRGFVLFLGSSALCGISFTPVRAQTVLCSLDALVTGIGSTACGASDVINGNYDLTSGLLATVTGNNSMSSGAYSNVVGDNGVALGSYASATNAPTGSGASNAVAVGAYSTAVTGATATGEASSATGVNSIAYGHSAVATQSLAMALGMAASATAANSVALGPNASAIATNAVAIGSGSLADTANTVSVGALGSERKIVNVAAGTLSALSTDVVNGSQLYATNTAVSTLNTQLTNITTVENQLIGSVGLVSQNVASRVLSVGATTDGTVISVAGTAGNRTVTSLNAGSLSGTSSDAVNGTQLYTANQRAASALGGGSTLDGNGQLTAPSYSVLGNTYNNVGGAVGALNTQVTTNTSNISSLTTQTASNTSNISSLTTNVASNTSNITNLQNQVTTGTIGLLQQNPTTQNLTVGSGVAGTWVNFAGSAGNRALTGIATGTVTNTSVDAVNGSQLYTANQRVASVLGGGSALDVNGQVTSPTYSILGSAYNNVGGALGALNTQVTSNTSNITNLQNEVVTGGIGLVQQNSTTQNLSVGSSTGGALVNFAGAAGNRVLTGLGNGTIASASADAVNGSQLYTANQRVTSVLGGGSTLDANGQLTAPTYSILGSAYNNVGGALGALNTQVTTNTADISTLQNEVVSGSVGLVQQNPTTQALTVASTTGGTVVNFAGTAGNRVLTGLGTGAISSASSDAVTGSQIYSANQRIASLFGGGSVVDATGQVTAPVYSILGSSYNNLGGALGALNTQVASNVSSISSLVTQTTTNTTNITTLQNQVATGAIGVVQQNTTTRDLNVGSGIDGTLVNFAGTAGSRTLTGIATGALSAASTDAVNGSQLYATNQALSNLSSVVSGIQSTATAPSPYLKVNGIGPAAVSTGTNAISFGSGATGGGDNAISVGTDSLASKAGSIAVGMNSSSTGTNAIAIGTGASATGSVAVGAAASAGNGGAAFGDGAVATAVLSTALGPNSSATAANAVAIGSGSVNTVANTVSFGTDDNQRRLTNVAAGINQTDAVNVSQLQSVASGFQSQVNSLQTQMNDNRQEARSGVALALAASGLRYDDHPGKWSIAGSYGNFKGASGMAVGLGYSATDKLRFNASVSGIPSQSVGAVVSGSLSLN